MGIIFTEKFFANLGDSLRAICEAIYTHPITGLIVQVLKIRTNAYKEFNYFFSSKSANSFEINFIKFLADFKKGCYESQHLKEDKNFQIRISSTKEDLKGISFETFNIDESNFYHYIDISKTYIENSPEVISISFKSKNLNENDKLVQFLNYSKSFIENLNKNISSYIRIDKDKITFDLIINNSSYFQIFSLLNLNILYKTDAKFSDLFNDSLNQFFKKLIKFDIQIKGKAKNANYFLTSFINNFEKYRFEIKIENFFKILSFLKSFIQFSLSLEVNLEEFVDTHKEEINHFDFVKEMMKAFLDHYVCSIKKLNLSPSELIKPIDLDNIEIFILFPKDKKGFANIIKFQGLNKYLNDNL